MKRLLLAVAAVLAASLFPLGAPAADTSDMAPVTAMLKAINAQTPSMADGLFTQDGTMVDEFAPFTWTGNDVGRAYITALIGQIKGYKLSNVKIHADKVAANQITGDDAYVVLDTTLTANMQGAGPTRELGALTAALYRSNGSWKIHAMAYVKTEEYGLPPIPRIDPAPFAVVTRALSGISANNEAETNAQYGPQAIILDEFAPFVWNGANALDHYNVVFAAQVKKYGLTNITVTPLSELKIFEYVVDNDAYLSTPVTFTALTNGKPITENGAFAYTLHKTNGAWKITGQYWARFSVKS